MVIATSSAAFCGIGMDPRGLERLRIFRFYQRGHNLGWFAGLHSGSVCVLMNRMRILGTGYKERVCRK